MTEFTARLTGAAPLDLQQTFECGQCFRWLPVEGGGYTGVVGDRVLTLRTEGDTLLVSGLDQSETERLLIPYLALDEDYAAMQVLFCQNSQLAEAVRYAPGIRVLRQDRWEALCSFIISQNNNIKRIKGIVQRLCSCLGEPIPSSDCFSFPSPPRLAAATLEELEPLRCGFRAKYLLDAARRVSSGQVQLDAIPQMPLEQARAHLMQIVGVGPKVADCALLYGFHRLECCPMDVWMKRVFAALYPNGLPDCAQDFIGIAQQYLFHYVRCCPQILEAPEKEAALV